MTRSRATTLALAAALMLVTTAAEARRHRDPPYYSERKQRAMWRPGDDVPEGYHPVTRAREGLAAVGAGVFGVPYAVSVYAALGGTDDARDRWLLLPVFGPLIYATTVNRRNAGDMAGMAVGFLVLDSIAQAAGLTMVIVGSTTKMTVLARNDVAVRVLPTCTSTGCALQAVGTF